MDKDNSKKTKEVREKKKRTSKKNEIVSGITDIKETIENKVIEAEKDTVQEVSKPKKDEPIEKNTSVKNDNKDKEKANKNNSVNALNKMFGYVWNGQEMDI